MTQTKNWTSIHSTCLQRASKKKNSLHNRKLFLLGGDKRDRTADLLHAMQALSQLSYTPIIVLQLYSIISFYLYAVNRIFHIFSKKQSFSLLSSPPNKRIAHHHSIIQDKLISVLRNLCKNYFCIFQTLYAMEFIP